VLIVLLIVIFEFAKDMKIKVKKLNKHLQFTLTFLNIKAQFIVTLQY